MDYSAWNKIQAKWTDRNFTTETVICLRRKQATFVQNIIVILFRFGAALLG